MRNLILRGEIYQAALDPVLGSEQGGTRPVLIVQNNLGNRYSPTVIALAMTSRTGTAGLPRDSVVLPEQVRTLDKQRLGARIGMLPAPIMAQVNRALFMSLGMNPDG